MTVGVLVGGDIRVDRAHDLPGASNLRVAGMLLHREPPPRHGQARNHDPAIALLLGALLHPDVHELEAGVLRLEPEVDRILLLRLVLVVEDDIGEPAIAFHAAHHLDLFEDEIEVGIELGIVEHEGSVFRALGNHLIDRLLHVGLGEILGEGEQRERTAKSHGYRRGSCMSQHWREPREHYWLVLLESPEGVGAALAAFAVASTLIA